MATEDTARTLFIALHDPVKDRYNVLVARQVREEAVLKFKDFLRDTPPEDVKHLWTIMCYDRQIDQRAVAPVICRYTATVRIEWEMASADVARRAAEEISKAFGFPIQRYVYIPPESPQTASYIIGRLEYLIEIINVFSGFRRTGLKFAEYDRAIECMASPTRGVVGELALEQLQDLRRRFLPPPPSDMENEEEEHVPDLEDVQ